MIDITKPLQLADGRKATFLNGDMGYVNVRVDDDWLNVRSFHPEGQHALGSLPNLVNATPAFQITSVDQRVQTRDGQKVRLLAVDGPDAEQPIVGIIDGVGVEEWGRDGSWETSKFCRTDDRDLVPEPKRVYRTFAYDGDLVPAKLPGLGAVAFNTAAHAFAAFGGFDWDGVLEFTFDDADKVVAVRLVDPSEASAA